MLWNLEIPSQERFTDHRALVAPAWIAVSTHQKPNSLPLTAEGYKGHKLSHSQAELLEMTLQHLRWSSSPFPLGSGQTSQGNTYTLQMRPRAVWERHRAVVGARHWDNAEAPPQVHPCQGHKGENLGGRAPCKQSQEWL